ncbi:hypothetical protein CUMW_176480 [Citrus unshiu]|uniref:Uncharacterized protein n=1 Tax=Citrus unshiu TaxID=55188 RepID=A0A2H5PYA8_CITUN|nr:hypothetical protein CUMW_176480 [Citrus unshiu]
MGEASQIEKEKDSQDQDNDAESRGKDQASTEIFPSAQNIINIEGGIALKKLVPLLLLYRKDTNAQLSGPKAGIGEYLIFPGGETQFENGALHYIDFIMKN